MKRPAPSLLFPPHRQPLSAQEIANETTVLRSMTHSLRLWALCRRAACYRMQRCSGDPRLCLPRYARLVPQEARDWVKAMFEGDEMEWDFDTLCENYPDELEAYGEWLRAVDRSVISDRRPETETPSEAPPLEPAPLPWYQRR
jgi:hypothetical protein